MAALQSTQFLNIKGRERIKDRVFAECWSAMVSALRLQDLPPCRYCGVIADTIDHVPARAVRPKLVEMGLDRRYPFVEVPCCRECNSALGTQGLTIGARRIIARKWLKKRYERVLRIPFWSDSELAELKPSFRNYVIQGTVLRQWVEERLEYSKREQQRDEE